MKKLEENKISLGSVLLSLFFSALTGDVIHQDGHTSQLYFSQSLYSHFFCFSGSLRDFEEKRGEIDRLEHGSSTH